MAPDLPILYGEGTRRTIATVPVEAIKRANRTPEGAHTVGPQ
jgi:hypothetical protein